MLTERVCLKKCAHVKIILKNLIQKKNNHTPSSYSLFTNCSFDATKNKLDYYKGEDFAEKFCKDLGDHSMKIINYEKNEMILLTNEENECCERQKVCYICNKKFNADKNDENAFKIYHKGRDHCHYTENLEELLIVFII